MAKPTRCRIANRALATAANAEDQRRAEPEDAGWRASRTPRRVRHWSSNLIRVTAPPRRAGPTHARLLRAAIIPARLRVVKSSGRDGLSSAVD